MRNETPKRQARRTGKSPRSIVLRTSRVILSLLFIGVAAAAQADDFPLPNGWTFGSGPLDIHVMTGDSVSWPSPIGSSHDVAELFAQGDYDACNVGAANIIAPPSTVDFSIDYDTAGTYFYVCTIGGGSHCNAGMKIRVIVEEATPNVPVLDGWGLVALCLGLLAAACGSIAMLRPRKSSVWL